MKKFSYNVSTVVCGEVEETNFFESDLEIKQFCEELYNKKVEELKRFADEEDLEDIESMLEEIGYVEKVGRRWEVSYGEEECYLVSRAK
jgi:hypothetical protein